ncbi:unnamed protein product [Arctogadus glacialis]
MEGRWRGGGAAKDHGQDSNQGRCFRTEPQWYALDVPVSCLGLSLDGTRCTSEALGLSLDGTPCTSEALGLSLNGTRCTSEALGLSLDGTRCTSDGTRSTSEPLCSV